MGHPRKDGELAVGAQSMHDHVVVAGLVVRLDLAGGCKKSSMPGGTVNLQPAITPRWEELPEPRLARAELASISRRPTPPGPSRGRRGSTLRSSSSASEAVGGIG